MNPVPLLSILPVFVPAAQQPSSFVSETWPRNRQELSYRTHIQLGSTEPDFGKVTLEFGADPPSEEETGALVSPEPGTRFSFSRGFAATLDTSVPLVLGKKKLVPGLYFLAFERSRQNGWSLIAIDESRAHGAAWNGVDPCPLDGVVVPLESEIRAGAALAHVLHLVPTGRGDEIVLYMMFGRLMLSVTAEPEAKKGRPAANKTKRMRAKLALPASEGAWVTVEHGLFPWNGDLERELDGVRTGASWPLAKDFWTTMQTSVPIVLGSKRVVAGDYSLTLVRAQDGEFELGLLDSARRRQTFAIPNGTSKLGNSLRVPLVHETTSDNVEQLALRFTTEGGSTAFEITWGPHRWSAAVASQSEK